MYAKIFAQIYDGTLCTRGPWEALVTFQQFLVLADQNGSVDMNAEAISRRTTIPLDIIQTGIKELLKPDPQSRTPTAEGRRLLPLVDGRDWGWKVVNYSTYRALKRETDKNKGAAVPPFALPDWVPAEPWSAWIEVRTKLRAPNTSRALALAVKSLADLKAQGHAPQVVLELATARGWRGLFAPKPVGAAGGGNGAGGGLELCVRCRGSLQAGYTKRRDGFVCNQCEAQS